MPESTHRPYAASPLLSIAIPVLDEGENISKVVAEIEEKLTGRVEFEVVFVDDGSSDNTVAAIREAAAQFSYIRLVRHRQTGGKSAGLITAALAARAEWIGTMDGDGQNDPADLWNLAKVALAPEVSPKLLLVAGHRRRRNDTRLKQMSSKVANGVRMRLSGDPTPDAACGLKVFRRDAFLELPRFDNMHRFLSALFRRHGGEVVSVMVGDRPRLHGESKYGLHNRLWVGISDLLGMVWLNRRTLRNEVMNEEEAAK
jgi:dolichol-phosphate mannosyltransferase